MGESYHQPYYPHQREQYYRDDYDDRDNRYGDHYRGSRLYGSVNEAVERISQLMGWHQSTEQPRAMAIQNYSPMRPDPGGLSPTARFNAMLLRGQYNNAVLRAQAPVRRANVEQGNKDWDAASAGPPPTSPYTITEPAYGSGNKTLTSKYGTGSVTQAIPGSVPRGKFQTSDGQLLPFGQVGGDNAGQDTQDPDADTFQQWLTLNQHKQEREAPGAANREKVAKIKRDMDNDRTNATLKSIGL